MSTIDWLSIASENSGDREGNISASSLRGGLSHSGTIEAGCSPMASASGRAVALADMPLDVAINA